MTTPSARVPYDEFAYFADNAAEFGIPYERPPVVRREFVELGTSTPGHRPEERRRLSALVWGDAPPQLVLLHGDAQNAHTWDTVALALDRPLVALDLPGHGHSDGARAAGTSHRAEALAVDVAEAIAALAPDAAAVVGMSLGGLTSIALAVRRPELVRRLALVDITPGVDRVKAKAITDFVRGPATFDSLDEILARTIEHNPTRTESSLRRGILHNAEQLDDGSWRWRYRRDVGERSERTADRANASEPGGDGVRGRSPRDDDDFFASDEDIDATAALWDALGRVSVPVLLARGMRPQSVVDDDDEAELLRRLPHARVVHFADAGHSVQGDMPVELAAAIAEFVG
jgi:pimeloyl-ACP methyl ester carboxylesterase